MRCLYPWWSEKEKAFFPCGHCFACRRAKASEWATRLIVELPYWSKYSFITLTYDDEHLPISDTSIYPTLKPKDLQDFWKRLRKCCDSKIKYFACGEYGGRFARPHYHAIVFGVGTSKEDMDTVTDCWSKGRTSNDYVNPASINYVVGYVMKKYGTRRNDEEYTKKGLEIPFQRCSRGIGLAYALAHGADLQRDLSVRLYTGRETALPRYFVKKLGIDTELLKNKASDGMVQMINGLFRRFKIDLEPTPANLGYMLFHSRQFGKSEALNNYLCELSEQKESANKTLESFRKK